MGRCCRKSSPRLPTGPSKENGTALGRRVLVARTSYWNVANRSKSCRTGSVPGGSHPPDCNSGRSESRVSQVIENAVLLSGVGGGARMRGNTTTRHLLCHVRDDGVIFWGADKRSAGNLLWFWPRVQLAGSPTGSHNPKPRFPLYDCGLSQNSSPRHCGGGVAVITGSSPASRVELCRTVTTPAS